MKSASIIIIPSLWQEPFGLVAAEAMSYGAAIIASNRGALSEIIGNNGVLIDKIDYEKLKSALTNLLSNKSQEFFSENLEKTLISHQLRLVKILIVSEKLFFKNIIRFFPTLILRHRKSDCKPNK